MISLPIFIFKGLKEEEVVKSKMVFRSTTVAAQNSETELILDGDDDTVSLLQEKEMDNLGGTSAQRHFDYHPFNVTSAASLVFSSVFILITV